MTLAPVQILQGGEHRGGLASVASPLPAGIKWEPGVQIQPVSAAEMFVWGCDSPGGDDKPETGVEDHVSFYSTLIGSLVACGAAPGALGPIERALAEEGFRRGRFQELAQVLHGGEVGRAALNPSLQSEASLPEGFDVANPACILPTLQGMLDAACECNRGDLIFHVPLAYMPHFKKDGVVEWDNDAEVYRFGPYLVSFDCYPNLGPSTPVVGPPAYNGTTDAIPNPDGSEVWIYMSSPPVYAWGELYVNEARDRRQNRTDALVEQLAVIAFDPSCTVAAKAEVC